MALLEAKEMTVPVDRKKLGKKAQSRVSAKIAHLIRTEGKTPKQAAGAAYGMERAGRLGPRGGYKKK